MPNFHWSFKRFLNLFIKATLLLPFRNDSVLGDHKYFFDEIQANKVCLWNTMPPIMANSNEGQDHKDNYFDTSRKIMSQEVTMCNMEAVVFLFKKLWPMSIFLI